MVSYKRIMVVRKTTRTMLFVLCTIIFIVAGTYAVLAMQGLVFDTEHFRLTKSGSIFVHFTPTDASIFIDGKKYPKTQGMFGGGILISNLVPRNYSISIMKDGYTPFTKTLEVTPGKVSVSARITLWKITQEFETLNKNINNVFPTSQGFIFETTSSTLLLEDEKTIKGSKVEAYDMSSSYIVTRKGSSLFLIDLTNPTVARDFSVLFRTIIESEDITDLTQIQKISFHPFSKTKLLIQTAKNLYIFDLKKSSIGTIETEGTPKAIGLGAKELFVTNKEGDLVIRNLILDSKYVFPINASTTKEIIPSKDGSYAFLLNSDKTLDLFNRTAQTVERIGTNIEYATFSPDSLRAAFIDTNHIASILYLEDYEGDVMKPEGSIDSFSISSGADLNTFEWIPFAENYFMIKVGKNIRIEETDIRQPRNVATIAKEVKKSLLISGDLFVLTDGGEFLKTTIEE
ncbi:MAG: Uncharacterized protein LiPW41_430 [Parcubacteria group bacterium LiPW_41]|nr:MAG: Uncharacterized protein LiPW41_430 [Parcubacteria group bacterium LiPW_41]